MDEGGIALGDLPVRGVFTVTFDVLLDSPLPVTIDRVRNVAIVRANGEERKPEVETPIDFDPSLNIIKTTNGEDANTPPGPIVRAGDSGDMDLQCFQHGCGEHDFVDRDRQSSRGDATASFLVTVARLGSLKRTRAASIAP